MNFFKDQPVRLDKEENLRYLKLQEVDYYLSVLSFIAGIIIFVICCFMMVGLTWGWL